jgi:hypothetical protein
MVANRVGTKNPGAIPLYHSTFQGDRLGERLIMVVWEEIGIGVMFLPGVFNRTTFFVIPQRKGHGNKVLVYVGAIL